MNESKRLWDKGVALDALIHRFTVGDDPLLDRQLVHWDCLGSAAHARALERAGLLTAAECATLLAGLAEIDALARADRFEIGAALEDCHTAIENHLTQQCGPAGMKIHTGRSRNDQIATVMRLFMRHHCLSWCDLLRRYCQALLERADREGATRMPGYTHMQPAMPSSVGQWLTAHAEAALDQLRAGRELLARLDACPLGTGAGFGVALPLDRAYTAQLLGFSNAQRNPIDVQNSRGRLEVYFARVASDVGAMLEKLACDLLVFTSREHGFFELPESMTTGSSIMPQKRNPDVLELMRAASARLRARACELEWVRAKLPSSYHRDLQLTKAPTLSAAHLAAELLEVGRAVATAFTVNSERLAGAMQPELYAADAAYALVRRGVPFREAYRVIGQQIRERRFAPEAELLARAGGMLDPLALGELRRDVDAVCADLQRIRESVLRAEQALLPAP